jgi:hypothetical protein
MVDGSSMTGIVTNPPTTYYSRTQAFCEKAAAWTAAIDEWEPVTTSVNFDA